MICFVSSFVSCTKSEANSPTTFDLSTEAKIVAAAGETISLDEVKKIIEKSVEICESNSIVKLDSDTSLQNEDVSHITADFAKSLTVENYQEYYEQYKNYLRNIQKTAVELLRDYFPGDNVIEIQTGPEFNSALPSNVFYFDGNDELIDGIKNGEAVIDNAILLKCECISVFNGDIYYHEGENDPVMLFPLPKQAEIENQFWKLNNQETLTSVN